MLLRLLFAIPVIGWMLRDAVRGESDSKAWFLANIVMIWLLAVVFFGYPAIIIPALVATASIIVTLVAMTAHGLVRRS